MGTTITPEIVAVLHAEAERNKARNDGGPQDAPLAVIYAEIPAILQGRGDPEKLWAAMQEVHIAYITGLYPDLTSQQTAQVMQRLKERDFAISGNFITGVIKPPTLVFPHLSDKLSPPTA